MKLYVHIPIMLVLAGAILAPAHAQKMYRCGNTYQDRPCDIGDNKVVGNSRAGASGAASGVDAQCAHRGAAAQKIVWSREAGLTEEQYLDRNPSADRKLIADAYRNRGASPVVRAAIEADCMAEKDQAAQAANLIAAASKLTRQAPALINPEPDAETDKAAAATYLRAANEAEESRVASRKKTHCTRLNARLNQLRSDQRTGGEASYMDALNQQVRDTQKELRDGAC
jgi:hypothetical protein